MIGVQITCPAANMAALRRRILEPAIDTTELRFRADYLATLCQVLESRDRRKRKGTPTALSFSEERSRRDHLAYAAHHLEHAGLPLKPQRCANGLPLEFSHHRGRILSVR